MPKSIGFRENLRVVCCGSCLFYFHSHHTFILCLTAILHFMCVDILVSFFIGAIEHFVTHYEGITLSVEMYLAIFIFNFHFFIFIAMFLFFVSSLYTPLW